MPTSCWKLYASVLLRANIVVTAALILAVATGPRTSASDTVVATKFFCKGPEIPALVLTLAFPREAAVINRALRNKTCRYTDYTLPVIPVFFVRRVRSGPNSAEPYGYIWAIRIAEKQVAYWFFWKNEHEAMLKSSSGI